VLLPSLSCWHRPSLLSGNWNATELQQRRIRPAGWHSKSIAESAAARSSLRKGILSDSLSHAGRQVFLHPRSRQVDGVRSFGETSEARRCAQFAFFNELREETAQNSKRVARSGENQRPSWIKYLKDPSTTRTASSHAHGKQCARPCRRSLRRDRTPN